MLLIHLYVTSLIQARKKLMLLQLQPSYLSLWRELSCHSQWVQVAWKQGVTNEMGWQGLTSRNSGKSGTPYHHQHFSDWLTDLQTDCVLCVMFVPVLLWVPWEVATRLKASPGKMRVPYPYQWALLNSCQADLLPLGLCQQPPPAHVPLKYPLFLPLCQNVNCGPASGPNYDYCSFKEKMDMAKLVAVQTL